MSIRSILITLATTAVIATTTGGFAQEIPPTLPAHRTLTDTAGRKIEATLTEKTGTTIKGKTVSGKEFDIPLAKLSAEDQAFIASLVVAPVKKPTVLITWGEKKLEDALEKAGFVLTVVPIEARLESPSGKPVTFKYQHPAVEKITDDELRKFDVVWVNNIVDFKQFERLRDLIPTGKTIVWCREWKTSKNKFLARDEMQHPGRATTQEYMNSDGNVVFYNWQIRKWDSTNGSTPVVKEHPEILDQVAAEAKRLVNLPVDSK